jgi:hypothetical protein
MPPPSPKTPPGEIDDDDEGNDDDEAHATTRTKPPRRRTASASPAPQAAKTVDPRDAQGHRGFATTLRPPAPDPGAPPEAPLEKPPSQKSEFERWVKQANGRASKLKRRILQLVEDNDANEAWTAEHTREWVDFRTEYRRLHTEAERRRALRPVQVRKKKKQSKKKNKPETTTSITENDDDLSDEEDEESEGEDIVPLPDGTTTSGKKPRRQTPHPHTLPGKTEEEEEPEEAPADTAEDGELPDSEAAPTGSVTPGEPLSDANEEDEGDDED